MSSRGGEEREVLPPAEGESDFHDVTVLPDGRGAVFVVHRGDVNAASNDTISVWDGETRRDILRIAGANLQDPSYDRSGHIVYARIENNVGVWAAPFSLDILEITGEPFLVAPQAHSPRVSREGTLTYLTGASSSTPTTQLVWVDRSGATVAPIGEPATFSPNMALSPDDSKVVIQIDGEDDDTDLWIYDFDRGSRARLTFEGGVVPSWSRDGKKIYFQRFLDGGGFAIYVKNADGSGEARKLVEGFVPSISPDGRHLIYNHNVPKDALWSLEVAELLEGAEAKPRMISESAFRGKLSPDGRYLAYIDREEGLTTDQVYVARFPEMTGKRQVSTEGGSFPQWRADGRELFYIAPRTNDLMAASVELEPTLVLGNPRRLFTRARTGIPNFRGQPDSYAASTDGQRFVIVEPLPGAKETGATPITVVTNWIEEFREE